MPRKKPSCPSPRVSVEPRSVGVSEWLDAKRAGARYGYSATHFRRLALAGQVPRGIQLLSRRPRWRLSDLVDWEERVIAAQTK